MAGHVHHDHDHGGGHERNSHAHGPADYSWAFAIGIALNFGFVVVEATYGDRSRRPVSESARRNALKADIAAGLRAAATTITPAAAA